MAFTRAMAPGFTALLAGGSLLLLGACDAPGGEAGEQARADGQAACPRPAAVTFAPGDTVVLRDQEPPCRIIFRDTDIVLRADPGGARPDPGRQVVRDAQGRFYSTGAGGFPAVVSLWDEQGEYVRSFGRPGEGPGEFSARGMLSLHIDALDRLHVRDGGPTWSVFAPDQTFLRRVPATVMGGLRGYTVILDDGRALTAQSSPGERSHHFRIVDTSGTLDRSFAPRAPALTAQASTTERRIGSAGGDTFWAGPPSDHRGYGPDGYTLQHWSLDGEFLLTLRREVPWFRAIWPPPDPQPEGGPAERPPVQVGILHLDDSGLLLVATAGPSEEWRPLTFQERSALSPEEQARWFEARIEVFDTRAGVLLASRTLTGEEMAAPPFESLFPGTRLGARLEEDEQLLPRVRIVEYELVAR
jgi:hypothetical protein